MRTATAPLMAVAVGLVVATRTPCVHGGDAPLPPISLDPYVQAVEIAVPIPALDGPVQIELPSNVTVEPEPQGVEITFPPSREGFVLTIPGSNEVQIPAGPPAPMPRPPIGFAPIELDTSRAAGPPTQLPPLELFPSDFSGQLDLAGSALPYPYSPLEVQIPQGDAAIELGAFDTPALDISPVDSTVAVNVSGELSLRIVERQVRPPGRSTGNFPPGGPPPGGAQDRGTRRLVYRLVGKPGTAMELRLPRTCRVVTAAGKKSLVIPRSTPLKFALQRTTLGRAHGPSSAAWKTWRRTLMSYAKRRIETMK